MGIQWGGGRRRRHTYTTLGGHRVSRRFDRSETDEYDDAWDDYLLTLEEEARDNTPVTDVTSEEIVYEADPDDSDRPGSDARTDAARSGFRWDVV